MDRNRTVMISAALLMAGLTVGYFLGSSGRPHGQAEPPAAIAENPLAKVEPAPITPLGSDRYTAANRLGANLYIADSAEYRACCIQIYQFATQRLKEKLALSEVQRPAVVLDLDETVVDNSAFQTALYAANSEYQPKLWDEYEKDYPGEVRLVPGAKEFLEQAQKLGVAPVFLSNRSEEFRDSTISALQRLSINTDNIADRLYLKPKGGSSDKAARRETVEARYNVLLWFGDNLRDFSEVFAAPRVDPGSGVEGVRAAFAERNRLADEAACHWGIDWFVLPNPVYGEWDKLIGKDPKAFLTPTTMKFPVVEADPSPMPTAERPAPVEVAKPEEPKTPVKIVEQ